MLNRKICSSLALILTLAASPALAAGTEGGPHQPAGAAANANSTPGCMMSGAEGGMPMMANHIEGRLAFLKTERGFVRVYPGPSIP